MVELAVSVLQWDVQFGDLQANRDISAALLEQAAKHGADIAVMPELCNSGYAFESKEEALLYSEPHGGETEQLWLELAQAHQMVIAGGINERDEDGTLYNGMLVVGPEGVLARYRKVHLFDREKLFFAPGQEMKLITVKGVKVGLMICYDGWFPEYPRVMALQGAQLILSSSCWIGQPEPDSDRELSCITMHLGHAYMNGIFLACAVRSGEERGLHYTGQSCLLTPYGRMGQAAPAFGDYVMTARFDMGWAESKQLGEMSDLFEDRRPELYTNLCKQEP